MVIGPNVYTNEGKADSPSVGDFVGTFLDEEALKKYRADTKNYFVSVNGCVYR